MKEWFTAAELAALRLPQMPTTKKGVLLVSERSNWCNPERQYPRDPHGTWRRRKGRGGGREYHIRVLPLPARARLAADASVVQEAPATPAAVARTRDEAWTWFDGLSAARKEIARKRLEALIALENMERAGSTTDIAMALLAPTLGISLRTFYNWRSLVHGVERPDWLAHLAPRHQGSAGRKVECDDRAWDWLRADYLRQTKPSFESCYRRAVAIGKQEGWAVPKARTMRRWVEAIPRLVRVATREGMEAAARLYPAQRRDRSEFHALQAINGDGHKWDLMVLWPDGSIARPMMVAFQDLYSNLILSWRVDRTENKEMVRLALGDLVEIYGIPELCWFDNGRAFASKMLSGGVTRRFRFKIRDEDPFGIFAQLGIEIHFTKPYSGQSKPIERAFGDLERNIATRPEFEQAYVGNKPDARPENFDPKKAVPLAEFLRLVDEGIVEHNAREGRRTAIAGGRSFLEVFNESYEKSAIRKPTKEQARLWLLAADSIRARPNGEIALLGNRYWDERLVEVGGDLVVVRFDPQRLHGDVHVYGLDGRFITTARCIEDSGFTDVDAGRAQESDRKRWLKAAREMASIERRLDRDEMARRLRDAAPEPTAPPETKVVRPLFNGNAALKPREALPELDEDIDDRGWRGIAGFVGPQLVKKNGAED